MGGFSSTSFSTYVFPSEVIFVFILPSGTTAARCFFKLLTSVSSSALRVCNCSTARSSFSIRSDSEALCILSGWMAANTQASTPIFLFKQYLMIDMIFSHFTAASADDCCFRALGTLKSNDLARLFACCEAAPVFGAKQATKFGNLAQILVLISIFKIGYTKIGTSYASVFG